MILIKQLLNKSLFCSIKCYNCCYIIVANMRFPLWAYHSNSVSVSVWFGQQNVLSRHIHANLVVEKRKVWIDTIDTA